MTDGNWRCSECTSWRQSRRLDLIMDFWFSGSYNVQRERVRPINSSTTPHFFWQSQRAVSGRLTSASFVHHYANDIVSTYATQNKSLSRRVPHWSPGPTPCQCYTPRCWSDLVVVAHVDARKFAYGFLLSKIISFSLRLALPFLCKCSFQVACVGYVNSLDPGRSWKIHYTRIQALMIDIGAASSK